MVRPGIRSRWLVVAVAGAAAMLGVPPVVSASAAPPTSAPHVQGDPQPFDVRQGGSAAQAKALNDRQAKLEASSAVRTLSGQLGSQSILDMDPLTGTPSQIARLDGMLTGPSKAPAREIALDYVRAHAAVFHLTGT